MLIVAAKGRIEVSTQRGPGSLGRVGCSIHKTVVCRASPGTKIIYILPIAAYRRRATFPPTHCNSRGRGRVPSRGTLQSVIGWEHGSIIPPVVISLFPRQRQRVPSSSFFPSSLPRPDLGGRGDVQLIGDSRTHPRMQTHPSQRRTETSLR
jgi:hypothetical protein